MLSSRAVATARALLLLSHIFPLLAIAKSPHHPIIDQYNPQSVSILTILTTPPTSFTKFLLSLAILAILTFLGQKFAAQISYWIGWMWRRLQGESAYEEGKKVVGWDSDDDEGKDGGEVEYVVGSEVGKMLDYVVSVDDRKVGGIKERDGGVRERRVRTATARRGV